MKARSSKIYKKIKMIFLTLSFIFVVGGTIFATINLSQSIGVRSTIYDTCNALINYFKISGSIDVSDKKDGSELWYYDLEKNIINVSSSIKDGKVTVDPIKVQRYVRSCVDKPMDYLVGYADLLQTDYSPNCRYEIYFVDLDYYDSNGVYHYVDFFDELFMLDTKENKYMAIADFKNKNCNIYDTAHKHIVPTVINPNPWGDYYD